MDAVWYIAGIAGVGIILIVLLSVAIVRRIRTMRRNDSQTLDSFSEQHALRGDQQEPMTGNGSDITRAPCVRRTHTMNTFPDGMSGMGDEESDHPDGEYKGD